MAESEEERLARILHDGFGSPEDKEHIKALHEEAKAARAQQEAAEAQAKAAQEERKAAQAEAKAAQSSKTPWHKKQVQMPPIPGAGLVSSALNKPIEMFNGIEKHTDNHGAKYMLIIVFILHFIDMYPRFSRQGSDWTLWVSTYAIVALVLAPLLLSGGWFNALRTKKMFVYAGVSAGAVFLPVLLSFIPRSITQAQFLGTDIFNLFIIISPLWAIYIMFSEFDDGFVNGVRKVWGWIWIIIMIALLLGAVTDSTPIPGTDGVYDIKPWQTIQDILDTVWKSLQKTWAAVTGLGPQVGAFVTRNLNDSIGAPYRGSVDPYSTRDLGVRFDELRLSQRTYYEGQDVIVYADVVGEQFKNEIALTLRCFAKNGKGEIFDGEILATGGRIPEELIFTQYQKTTARCTIPNLPQGRYDVTFAGTFNFETWSYVPYYFAPLELVQDLYQDGVDPATNAGIDSYSEPIFNNGPVMLGLASEVEQPIPIDTLRPRILPVYGAALSNFWYDGEIGKVRDITLLVPNPFKLINCDRKDKYGEKLVPRYDESVEFRGYKEYVFDDIANPEFMFESVTCYLAFDGNTEAIEEENAEIFMQSYDLVMKTFGAKTRYLYTIQEQQIVRVEKVGGTLT